MLKQKRGITLIALIITIIALLIIVGVSINMISGADGILTNSQYAAEKYKNIEEDERNKLNEIEMQIANAGREVVTIDKEEYTKLKEDVEELKNKSCIYIVESGDNGTNQNAPTAWYLKFSNGVIEQWGTGSVGAWGSGYKTVTVNLLKPYTTSNYNVSITNVACNYDWGGVSTYNPTRNTSNFVVAWWSNFQNTAANTFEWHTIGY